MDDLEHSILIAGRDWDSFYEESEECSIQQAQLASLDDSGLSDTDDEKKYTQEPVLPLLTNPGKNEEHDAVSQTLSTVDDCDKGNPLEDSECLNHKTDVQQTTQISLNENTATCVCLSSSDSGVNDIGPDDQQNASDAKNIQEHDQSQGTNKSSQVMEEPIPITTSPSTNAANSEGETLTKVMESSATPKKEKERWFVTVNDSPVQQKVHSGTVGQKKRRKKKTSKKSGHRNSAMGDFDEEFLQIINTSANPSPEPQSVNEQTNSILESNYISELLLEQELPTVNKESDSEDIIVLCPEDGMPLYLYPATEAHGLYLTPKAESNGNPFDLEGIRNTPSPVLSVGSTLEDQCLFSFSELFAKDIDEQGLQTRTPDRCSSAVSFYSSKKLSVPETYDDFFSDFVVGNLLFPSVQDQTVTVPIFSSSRSVVRDLVFPEVEELIEMNTEDDNSPVHFMGHFSNQLERSTSPLRSPNIYFFTGQRRHWSSFLSLRKIRFIDKGSTWCQKVSSWIFPKEATKVTSYVSRAQPMPHLFNVGDGAQEPFVVQQDHVQYTASISKRECLHFSIKQSDMCLVCIAFASWILKSYNPQSTDMWKAALLANVSAISAIQYLRKYVKKDATEDNS
ncbi:hypothetical protein SRHO_G00298740 [Serrasalmus rhombeus]